MSKPKPWTSEEDAKLEALANAGESWDAIAATLGRPKSALWCRVRFVGMHLGPKAQKISQTKQKNKVAKRTRAESIAIVARMMKEKASPEEIAKALNVRVPTVFNWTAEARKIAFPEKAKPQPIKSEKNNSRGVFGGPLPAGHPIAMKGLWRGLEHWRIPGFQKVVSA